jgi:endonuclease/exonuclease/phosphatase family metal-dependent hydrolase
MSETAVLPSTITVGTWNLWWRFGDWQGRLAAITEVLAELRPDVLALQEVWATCDQNAAELLADALGMAWGWAASPCPEHWRRRLASADPGRPEIGNAIVSRWPILDSRAFDLPFGARGNYGRTVLAAVIDVPGGTLPFFSTQLDSHPADSAVRVTQVTRLARLVSDHRSATYPPVVAGDFNAIAESDEMRLLEGHLTDPVVPGQVLVDAWRYAPAGESGATWDRRNPHVAATGEPAARIDHILVGLPSALGAGRVLDVARFGTDPVHGVWPSDHAGVTARLATPASGADHTGSG